MSKQDKNIFHELPIDYKDSQEIFLKQGKIIGSVKLFDVINIENVTKDIKNEFREEIKKAKGILIHFESFRDISLFTINDFISSVRENAKRCFIYHKRSFLKSFIKKEKSKKSKKSL